MTMKVGENQPGIHNCVCGKLQVSANAFTDAILGKVSFLVSRLPESGKKVTCNHKHIAVLTCGDDPPRAAHQ